MTSDGVDVTDQNIKDFENDVELREFVHVSRLQANYLRDTLEGNLTEEQAYILNNMVRQASRLIDNTK